MEVSTIRSFFRPSRHVKYSGLVLNRQLSTGVSNLQPPLSGEIAMAGKRSFGSQFAKQEVVNRRTQMKKGERTVVRTALGTHFKFCSDILQGQEKQRVGIYYI